MIDLKNDTENSHFIFGEDRYLNQLIIFFKNNYMSYSQKYKELK